MQGRLISAVLVVTLGAGCARAAVATGAVAVLYGGAVLVDEPGTKGGSSPDARPFLGFSLVVVGLVAMAVGGLAIAWEEPAPPPPALATSGATTPAGLEAAERTVPAGDAAITAAPDPRFVQLSLEARAGHCGTVAVIARALAAKDARPVVDVIRRDAFVARCLASRG